MQASDGKIYGTLGFGDLYGENDGPNYGTGF